MPDGSIYEVHTYHDGAGRRVIENRPIGLEFTGDSTWHGVLMLDGGVFEFEFSYDIADPEDAFEVFDEEGRAAIKKARAKARDNRPSRSRSGRIFP